MKASDLREKGVEDLRELHKSLARDVFQNRLKNFTNRLDDTSTMRKTKRDLARVATLLRESEMGIVRSPASGPEAKTSPEPAERKPVVKARKATAGAKTAPKKSAAKKADAPKKSKKSEAKQS
jgi:large subunit ribosomal protein L29